MIFKLRLNLDFLPFYYYPSIPFVYLPLFQQKGGSAQEASGVRDSWRGCIRRRGCIWNWNVKPWRLKRTHGWKRHIKTITQSLRHPFSMALIFSGFIIHAMYDSLLSSRESSNFLLDFARVFLNLRPFRGSLIHWSKGWTCIIKQARQSRTRWLWRWEKHKKGGWIVLAFSSFLLLMSQLRSR